MKTLTVLADWFAGAVTNIWGWIGAGIGLLISWWTHLPALAQAVLIVQCADIATGLACALLGKSQKSESGRVSSKVMAEGLIKKGAEWLIVLVCIYTGAPLGMDGISAAAMTYVVAIELVSLLENLALLGLDVPLLHMILDVAHGQKPTV